MEVEYTCSDYNGNSKQETQSIVDFLHDEILCTERYDSLGRDKVHLEEQPKKVLQVIGRLIEKLLDKNVLNLDDLKYISDCSWGKKCDTLALKKEA